MREDFRIGNEKLEEIGIMRIVEDHYMTPQKRGTIYFVKSPVSLDKTTSLAIYPSSNHFCYFANGNKSGDIVGLYAYIKNCNQWQALQELLAYYGLSGRQQDKEEARLRIQRQQAEERKRAARKQEFHNAVSGEISRLKGKLEKHKATLQKSKIEPFSNLWIDIQNEIQRTENNLNILTAADMTTYRRMKPNSDLGLSSDRPAWLLDCLAILSDIGAFKATEEEIREITAQRNFELCRMPGRDWRCKVEW